MVHHLEGGTSKILGPHDMQVPAGKYAPGPQIFWFAEIKVTTLMLMKAI